MPSFSKNVEATERAFAWLRCLAGKSPEPSSWNIYATKNPLNAPVCRTPG